MLSEHIERCFLVDSGSIEDVKEVAGDKAGGEQVCSGLFTKR